MNRYFISYLFLLTLPLYSDSFNDQRGMTKLLGLDTYSRCAKELSKEDVKPYELSYERTGSMPKSPFAGEYKPKFLPITPWEKSVHVFTMDVLNKDVNDGNQGTQIDALGHFGYFDDTWDGKSEIDISEIKFFGEKTQDEVKPLPDSPLLKLGIESVPPIVTSAVFIDVRKHMHNGEAMKAGEYVTVDDVKESLAKSSLKERGILPGDVVLIYTGWSDNYEDPDISGIYYSMAPGISYNLAKYLISKKVVGVGLDTWGVDRFADPNNLRDEHIKKQNPPGIENPAHHLFLTQEGIHTLENFKLDELSKDNVDLSCIMILPLLTKGSSGSPIRPVAFGSPNQS